MNLKAEDGRDGALRRPRAEGAKQNGSASNTNALSKSLRSLRGYAARTAQRAVPTTEIVLLALLLAASSARGADSLADRYASLGTLTLTKLVSAPFPHPSRADGHRYQDRLYPAAQHYSDSTVALFIPKGFVPGEKLDFVIHFHGWRNNVTNALREYRLVEQFSESRRNAILIVPEGPRDSPDSFGGKLEDAGGLKRFVDDVLGALPDKLEQGRGVGRIILSGHSGGYRVIAHALERGGLSEHVREVYLFDALYGETAKFRAWQEQTKGRLVNIYTAGGGTRKETERFMAELKMAGRPFLAKEKSLSTDDLKGNRLVFLFTDLAHNDVVAKQDHFRDFLRTSGLDARPHP